MLPKSIAVLLCAVAIALIVGCSGAGNSGSPLTPPDQLLDDSPGLTSGASGQGTEDSDGRSAEVGHSLWGFWQGRYNRETGEFEILSLRDAQFHLNVVQFLQAPYPPGLSVTINSWSPAAGMMDIDLTIIHPFPDSNLRGFDVRGIMMGDGGNYSSSLDPAVLWPSHDNLRILNADGYTRWWNYMEFLTPGAYGFTPGDLGFLFFQPQSTLHGYKYFSDPLTPTDPVVPKVNLFNRGTFSTDRIPPELTRNYVIQFPMGPGGPNLLFQYAIDASWATPTGTSPKPKPISDYPIEANCPEAYHIKVDTTGTTAWYDGTSLGGDLVLTIEVYDWKAPDMPNGIDDEISGIWIESPTLFPGPINVPGPSITGSSTTSGIFHINVAGVTPTGTEDQEVLITVRSADPTTYEPPVPGPVWPAGASLAAYKLVDIPILNEKPEVGAITVEVPDGGEVWYPGTSQMVTWTWEGEIPNVDILFSIDSGANYPTTLVEGLPNNGQFQWGNLPPLDTTTCRIMVVDSSDDLVFDESDDDFSIIPEPQATITVETPNGGEVWGIDSIQSIEWSFTGTIPQVDIDLSLDGGANYTVPIISGLPNDGEYVVNPVGNWPTDQARIRVSESGAPGASDESDNDFNILEISDPIIVLIPNGGEVWVEAYDEDITWSADGTVLYMKIDLSVDSGMTFPYEIIDSTPNDGIYFWQNIPAWAVGDSIRIRISDADDMMVYDDSDDDFSVLANPPMLQLLVPNGGETWIGGSSETILWTSSGSVGVDVRLEYVVSFGMPVMIAITQNDGEFLWDPIPMLDTDEVVVIVTSISNPSVFDQSDEFFTINTPEQWIIVDYPNGGEMFIVGTAEEILWSSESVTGQVKIEYITSDILPPIEIVAATDNDGAFMWDPIPNTPTIEARVMITSVDDPAIWDQSDEQFTIAEEKSLTVLDPNGGENLTGGSSWNITWDYTGLVFDVIIELSTNGGNSYDTVITPVTQCDGEFTWDPIPEINTNEGMIMISDVAPSGVFDESDGVFTITTVADSITVIQPNGGEILYGSDSYEIQWQWTGDMTFVDILYSIDSGVNYDGTVVNAADCTGSYTWDPIPDIDTTQARIMIVDVDNAATFDESDGDFTISTEILTGWNPIPGQTRVALTDPAPNQDVQPVDLAVFSAQENESRIEFHDQADTSTFKRYNDDYTGTLDPEWEYGEFTAPLHKFDVLPDGSYVFVTNANDESWPDEEINDPTYCGFTGNDNETGERTGGGTEGYYFIYADQGDPDPDDFGWHQVVDMSCGVWGGIDDTTAWHIGVFSDHPDNPQPHDGNIILQQWTPPYGGDEWNWRFLSVSTQGGGDGYVDDTDPDSMALGIDDDTGLEFDQDEPVTGVWILESTGVIQGIGIASSTGNYLTADDKLGDEEFGTATGVDLEIANAKTFDYSVTDTGFNWICVLLDNGDGTWSVGVWEYDYLDLEEHVFIDLTDPIVGTPMALDIDGADFEIHVLSENAGVIEATVFDYTPE